MVSAAPPASVLRIRRRGVGVGVGLSLGHLLDLSYKFGLRFSDFNFSFDLSGGLCLYLSLGSSFSLNLVRLRYYVSFSGGLGWRGGS